MGIDYGASLEVGFFFDGDELTSRFGKTRPAIVRDAVRYNEVTGAPYHVEVVEQPAQEFLRLGTQEFDELEELLNAVCIVATERIGRPVVWSQSGNMYSSDDSSTYTIGLRLERHAGDWNRIDISRFADADYHERAVVLKDVLEELGFDTGPYEVRAILDVG